MSEIYSQALQVLVWLGPDIERIAEGILSLVRYDERILAGLISGPDDIFVKQLDKTLHALAQSAWFSRLWVVRELALAKAAIFLWGREKLDYSIVQPLLLAAFHKVHDAERKRFGWMRFDLSSHGFL